MALTGDKVRVEIGFTTEPWAATTTWTAVSNISATEMEKRGVVSVTVDSGRNGEGGGTFDAARMVTVARDRDADWDQANSGSVFGVANLKRNKKIRCLVSDDSFVTSRGIFNGYIDDIVPSGTSLDGVATVTASDIMRLISEYDVDDLVRPLEYTGDRVTAILDAIGVPAAERGTIENGTVFMPAATLASDALSLLQQCAKAEYGFLYVTPDDGKINFRERYALLSVTAWSVRQHSFTADGNGTSSAVLHAPLARTLGSIHNVTRVTSSGDSGVTFAYDTTAASNPKVTPNEGPHGLSVEYDADVEVAAEAWHKGWDFTGQRARGFDVQVYPGNDNAVTAISNGHYESLTRVELQTKPVGYSTDWNFEARIERVSHQISIDLWSAHVTVSPHATQWVDDGDNVWYSYGATHNSQDLGAL